MPKNEDEWNKREHGPFTMIRALAAGKYTDAPPVAWNEKGGTFNKKLNAAAAKMWYDLATKSPRSLDSIDRYLHLMSLHDIGHCQNECNSTTYNHMYECDALVGIIVGEKFKLPEVSKAGLKWMVNETYIRYLLSNPKTFDIDGPGGRCSLDHSVQRDMSHMWILSTRAPKRVAWYNQRSSTGTWLLRYHLKPFLIKLIHDLSIRGDCPKFIDSMTVKRGHLGHLAYMPKVTSPTAPMWLVVSNYKDRTDNVYVSDRSVPHGNKAVLKSRPIPAGWSFDYKDYFGVDESDVWSIGPAGVLKH